MRKLAIFAFLPFICASAARAGEAFGEAVLFDSSNRSAMALDIEGRYLYGGAGDLVAVFDISDPFHPKKVGQVAGVGAARQLVVQNGFAYVTSREYGLWIVDATDPTHPRIRSRFDTCELATGVDVAGDVCFCGQRQNGVEFIDVRDPDHPRHIAMQKTDESQSVLYRDGFLYSGEWQASRVTVFDARDMANIRRIRTVDLRGYGDGLWSQGRYLYASRGHHGMHRDPSERPVAKTSAADREKSGFDSSFHGMGHGLDVFDMADPANPKRVGTVDFPPLFARGLDMWTPRTSGDLLVAAQTHNGLIAVDISDKAHPKMIDRWISPSTKPHYAKYPSDCVGSVAIGNGAVYAAVNGKGFFVLPCPRARIEKFETGILPKNASYRASYAADATQWHVWRPRDVGQVRAVAFRGDVAYVACGDAGLYLLDVLPGNGGWKERCKVEGREQVYDVSVLGDRLYTAEGGKGFGVYDISGTEPKELYRLPYMTPWRNLRANLAFWIIALDDTRLLCSDRKNWVLYDISHLPEFRMLKRLDTSVPGWDKFVMDRAIGGHYVAFNNCHHDVRWFDTLTGDCVARTKRNCTTLLNGICAFGADGALYTRGGGCRILKPLEIDPADGSLWPLTDLMLPALPKRDNGGRMHPGMPRSDGRYVVTTRRIDRYAQLFDFADPAHPVALGGWQFKGNPDVAAFYKGRPAIPCGYEGLLLLKTTNRKTKGCST